MAKEIKAKVKLQIVGGRATPAPPVGNNLGQHQISIPDFCKRFNAETAQMQGKKVPVIVTVFKDKTFDIEIKTTPVTDLIKEKINLSKGSSKPHAEKVGRISWKDIEDIARIKMRDLTAIDLERAKKVIAGSARSMGVDVVD